MFNGRRQNEVLTNHRQLAPGVSRADNLPRISPASGGKLPVFSELSSPGGMFSYNDFFKARLDGLRQLGRYRHFLEIDKAAARFPVFEFEDTDGNRRSAVNWCSNDYLCMGAEEEVISKMSFTALQTGTSSGGTRNISGTTTHHRDLENVLAAWHGKPSALLFNGAYAANLATLQTIGRQIPDLVFFSDDRNHASMIEGMRSAGNRKFIFPHNDVASLESQLRAVPSETPKLIAFESVYSMSGTVAPVADIVQLAKKYNALTYVDEVHAVGLYGKSGAGILQREGLQQEVDIINGTLSKAIGVFGGYVCGTVETIDFIRSFASGFIFTTSLPPSVCAAAAKSIALIQADSQRRSLFHANVVALRKALAEAAVPFVPNPSHITRIPVKGADACRAAALRLLLEYGIYIQPINHPTVPEGEECLRVIIGTRHREEHIHSLVAALRDVLPAVQLYKRIMA